MSVAPSQVAERGSAGEPRCSSNSRTDPAADPLRTNSLTDIDYTVKDTDCDANDVYTRMRVYTKLVPDGTDTSKRYNSTGCNTTVTFSDLKFEATNHITGVRVYACVDDAGPDSCSRSSFKDNPKVD